MIPPSFVLKMAPESDGSSLLDEAGRETYLERFDAHYVRVPTLPAPYGNRAARRAAYRRTQLRNDGSVKQ